MKDARFFLMVRFTVEPQALAQVTDWLDGGGFVMIYGIESRAAFEAYEADAELKARFARERAPFEKFMRIERFTGEVEAAHAA